MDYKRLYKIIKEESESIKSIYSYKDLSGAFGHLFLKMMFEISDDECYEAYTDGGDDNGIDAIYFNESNNLEIHFFQFKFPGNESTIDKGVTQDEALKIFNGARVFISDHFDELSWNDELKDARTFLENIGSKYIGKEKYIIHIVRFSSLPSSDMQNIQIIKENILSYKKETGITFLLEQSYAFEIDELYQKYIYSEWPTIQLKYSSRSIEFDGGNSKTSLYYISLYDLYDQLNDKMHSVFEGNVRYFLGKNLINKNIINTLINRSECQNFHLLNNGITIVCDKYDNQDRNNIVLINRCSIINGAQTVGSIISTINEFVSTGRSVDYFKDSFVLVKVINVYGRNPEMINKLVLTLNTQNPMARSYRVSNDVTVRQIKDYVFENSKYILTSKRNEFEHLKLTTPNFSKTKDNCFDIETALKITVSFENIKGLAPNAKRRMSILFKDENIDEILNSLGGEKMIIYLDIYKMLNYIVNGVRKILYDNNAEIDNTFLVHGFDKSTINMYRFVSLGDTLIMFAIGEYCRINNKDISSVDQDFIFNIIKEIAPLYQNNDIYNYSRSSLAFLSISNLIKNNKIYCNDNCVNFPELFSDDYQNATMKKENISEDALCTQIYSLANTNGGNLYVGIDDGQTIQNLNKKDIENVKSIIDNLKDIELKQFIKTIDNKTFMIIYVSKSSDSKSFNGKYFIRLTNGFIAEYRSEEKKD